MASIFELNAATRTLMGKGASRRLRRTADQTPAIIYGAGKEPLMISLDHNKVIQAIQHEAFFSHILTLNIDGKPEQVIIKDLQRHPYKPQILHLDFLRIKANEKIHMTIPLHFINEDIAKGVKIGGGVIAHSITEAEISCLPKDLPEYIEVDLTDVDLGQILHLSDIKLPAGVSFTNNITKSDENLAVVSIYTPRVVEEVEEGAPEAIETEITSEKKPTEEEGKETKEVKESKKE